jgi:hypothetical protein
MPPIPLREVFGVHNPPPPRTYVDRAGLDERIKYFLTTGRHLVIFGPSKQGKSALRRKALSDEKAVIIQCRKSPTCQAIYEEILGELGVRQVKESENADSRELSAKIKAGGGAGIPFVVEGKAETTGAIGTTHEKKEITEPIGRSAGSLAFLADAIKKSGRRVVIEDFHYIPEDSKKEFAVEIKGLLEYGVSFILVGAWEEPHVLIAYNGDLAGRVDEINLRWTDPELFKVLQLGQEALNVTFAPHITRAIVADSSGNIGLLQRIAEKLCMQAGIFKSIPEQLPIDDNDLLVRARVEICREEAQRYRRFAWSVSDGFANSNERTKGVYMRIIQVCVESAEAELLAGLPQDEIVERIKKRDPAIKANSIRDALNRIDSLQTEKAIYPVIATFNPVGKVLNLADRELLFYRKYGGPRWPWEAEEEGERPNG